MWAADVSDATQAATVLADKVDRSFEDDIRMGRVLNIPDRSNPAVRVKTEDTSATWSNITETRQQITINRQAYVAYLIEDIAELQSNVNIRDEYTSVTGYSLMAYLEGDGTSGLVSLGSGFSQNPGTLGQEPSDDDFLRALQYLDDGDVPDTDRFIWCAPSVRNAMLKINRFISRDYVSDGAAISASERARIKSVYGADVYVSSLANANPSAAAQSYAWFCHRRGVALLMQRDPTVHTQYVILENGWGTLVDMVYQFAERLIAPSTLGGGTSDDRFNVAISAN